MSAQPPERVEMDFEPTPSGWAWGEATTVEGQRLVMMDVRTPSTHLRIFFDRAEALERFLNEGAQGVAVLRAAGLQIVHDLPPELNGGPR